jgi:hypothetical protein
MRPRNWKKVCEGYQGYVFQDGREYLYVFTDYHVEGLFSGATDDNETCSFNVLKLPKSFDEFRAQFGDLVEWDAVQRELDYDNPGYFTSLLRNVKFARGKDAACLYASLLDDLFTQGAWLSVFYSGEAAVTPMRAGDVKRVFDPTYVDVVEDE